MLMERNLITGFSVDPSAPSLFATAEIVSLRPGDQINFDVSAQRWCVGYDDPTGDLAACPQQAEADSGSRCDSCTEKTRILPCLRCTGATCGNPARRAKCVFADHYVYLALYNETLFKVGVTRAERLERRITEQGAFAAVAIAAAGGQEVRRIEYAISSAGWPDRVNMLALLDQPSIKQEDAQSLLKSEVRRIAKRLPDERIIEKGPFVYPAPFYPDLSGTRPRQINPVTDPLAGTVIGIRGGYLLLEVESQTLTVSLRGLIGRELQARSTPAAGPAQSVLAF
jgi:hypothetical protein